MKYTDIIQNYLPHEDPNYLLELIKQIEIDFDIFSKDFCQILASDNADGIVYALTLARDLVNQPNIGNYENSITKLLFSSEIILSIREAVHRKEILLRNCAIYTLGKIGDEKSAQLLKDLLVNAINDDPLILSSLIFEYNWLTKSKYLREIVDIFLKSKYSCVRWILLEYLDSCSYERRTKLYFLKLRAIDKLSKSTEYFISEKAIFMRREMLHKKKGEWKKDFENIGSNISKAYKGPFYHSIQDEYSKHLEKTGYVTYGSEDYSQFIKSKLSRKLNKSVVK